MLSGNVALIELTLEPEAFVLFFNALACNIIKKSYAILADVEQAKRCFEMVIKMTPTLDEGYLNMGLLL